MLVLCVRFFVDHEQWMSFAVGVLAAPATISFTWLLFMWGNNRVLVEEGTVQDALRLCIVMTITGVPCCTALHEWWSRKVTLERLERQRVRSD